MGGKKQEVTVRLAAAKKTSYSTLSRKQMAVKEQQKASLRAFLNGQHILAGFGKRLAEHHSAESLATTWLHTANVALPTTSLQL